MKALCTTTDRKLELREIPAPTHPAPEHLLVRMDASAINPGDITFLKMAPPPGAPRSLYDVWGVSGAGSVIGVGDNVPAKSLGKQVAVYRSLVVSDHTIGTWSEMAQLHHSACVILPDEADSVEYSGSLVNTITPFAFLEQARQEHHRGVLVTAGGSATGIAMLGLAQAFQVPIVSIVRSEAAKEELLSMGAKTVLVTGDPDFDQAVAAVAEAMGITAVFDGVGGELLSRLLPRLAPGSTVYAYGHLGGSPPVRLHSTALTAKRLTITGFSNFGSRTVQDRDQLREALERIGEIIHMPHFKTKPGQTFRFDQIGEAMAYATTHSDKAILVAG